MRRSRNPDMSSPYNPVQASVGYLLVCTIVAAIVGSSFSETNIREELRIGLLLPEYPLPPKVTAYPTKEMPRYPFFLQMVKPAVDIALETIKEEILPGHVIKVFHNDTGCDYDKPTIIAVDQKFEYLVDVIVGPACEYACSPVMRLALHWDTPVLSAGCNAAGLDPFSKVTTRVGNPYSKLGPPILDLTEDFGWKTIVMLVNENKTPAEDNQFQCTAIWNQLHVPGKNLSFGIFEESESPNFTKILEEDVYPDARVVFMCASSDTIRQIMLEAEAMDMVGGDYAFFSLNPYDSSYFGDPGWHRDGDSDETNDRAKKAYEALMTIQLYSEPGPNYTEFAEDVKKRAINDYNYDYDEHNMTVNSFVSAFHDAVILYALALNESLADPNGQPRNGTEISSRMWDRTFQGISGDVTIDANGDRDSDYSLKDMNKDGEFKIVGIFNSATQSFDMLPGKKISWPGSVPPRNEPLCGFTDEKCEPHEIGQLALQISLGTVSLLLVLFVVIITYVYRKYTYERELANTSWRVKWDDISFNSKVTRRFGGSRMSLVSNDSGQSICGHKQQIFTVTGFYKGIVVAIKKIDRERVDLTRLVLMEMKAMREIQHDHITKFIGCCPDYPNISIMTEYCPKGSLQDILENDSIELDEMFKISLMNDLVKGIHYIHSSLIHSHGNLKSSNCVVDNRFVLKVTDFGLITVRHSDHVQIDEEDSYRYYHRQLWTAPELLRLPEVPLAGTQKGDVYSFGIIIQEIMLREGVFYFGEIDLSPQEIVSKVKQGTKPPFRPVASREHMPVEVLDLMNRCLAETPVDRPDFPHLRTTVRKLNKGRESGNLVDNLLSRMETYASNLEDLVEERTEAFYEEKKKAEDLLYQILPKPVAEELKKGKPVTAETFDSVSIYFSDIVGFTKLSSASTPLQVVDLLNDLYTAFDAIIDNFNVYKVETIGDAYMVVSGLPIRNGDYHAREIARMSLALLKRITTFQIRHKPDERLKLRIGLHSGPAVAGVVGLKMPRYCLFGDTVNTASRMESNGEAMKIHVSSCTKKILELFGTFVLERRGEVEMKGKGIQTTYWLNGELKDQNGICDMKYQEVTDNENNTLVDDTPTTATTTTAGAATNHVSHE